MPKERGNAWLQENSGRPGQETTGPRYDEPSGVRIGRGSVIPDWIEAAPMRNVSIRGLEHYQAYAYFVSPDDKVVILSPSSRRVARIMRRRA
jgi:hypothetical protein